MKRATTASFVLRLKLNTSSRDECILNKRFFYAFKIYNVLVNHVVKQINKVETTKEYWDIKNNKTQVREYLKKYDLSLYQLEHFALAQQHKFKRDLDSNSVAKIAAKVWESCEKHFFGNGKSIHHRAYLNIRSIEGKSNKTGIRFCGNKILWNKLSMSVTIPYNDAYAMEALQHRVKYCRIYRIPINGRFHYYVDLILEGIPPKKHFQGTGRSGIDLGPSTVAVITDYEATLTELADTDINNRYEQRIADISRRMDISKRLSNPSNYNADGTPIKGKHDWTFTKTYKKLKYKKANVQRKQQANRRIYQNRLANRILEQTDEVYIERMNIQELSRKKKRKKGPHFGKSVTNYCPSQFESILERKLNYSGHKLYKVNTYTFKASQYNHIDDTYTKKKLNDRITVVGDNVYQRDLYSAFLLMNSKSDLQSTDRTLCFANEPSFKTLHDYCMDELIATSKKYPSSFGIEEYKKLKATK